MSLRLKIISPPRQKRNYCLSTDNFVPKHLPVREDDVDVLRKFILQSKKIVVLTGAGVSTESGDLLIGFLPHIKSSKVYQILSSVIVNYIQLKCLLILDVRYSGL